MVNDLEIIAYDILFEGWSVGVVKNTDQHWSHGVEVGVDLCI